MTMPRIPYQLNEQSSSVKDARSQSKRRKKARVSGYLAKVPAHLPAAAADPDTGRVYPTRALALAAQRNRRAQILLQFAEMVRTNTLGQDPWERLPGETDLGYERFTHYLMQTRPENSPHRRTFTRTAAHFSVRPERVYEMAHKWHWALRADCWDREMEHQAQQVFVEERRASARRQARLGTRLQELALIGADNMVAVRGADLTPADVARLADTGVKIERLARGDATSHEARETETRLVWAGPPPSWAASATPVEPVSQSQSDSDFEEEPRP